MSIAAVSMENCENIRIGKMEVDGFEVGLDAKNTRELSIGKITTNNCNAAINLEDCWDSDIKDINIKCHSRKFSYTTLSSSIMASKNIK